KTAASPLENINVNLTVSITVPQDTYYAIDESYPSGWTLISASGDTNQSGHIKWVIIQGGVNTNHTYVIRAPASPGTYTFSGVYMFNTTYPNELAISGPNQVTVSSTPSLVSHWKFDETSGTTASDSSGNGNTGTLQNSPTRIAGKIGTGALSLDGADDYVSTTSLFYNPQDFSISVWFRTSSASGRKIVGLESGQTGTASTNYDRHIYMGTDGRIHFGWYSGVINLVNSTSTLNDNNWHHAVGIHSGSTGSLYIDGVLNGSGSNAAENFNGYWRMGGYMLGSWPLGSNGYFPGSIDDVRIYNYALSSQEILSLYQAGADTTPPSFAVYTPLNNTQVQTNYIYVHVGLSENAGTCLLNWYNGTWTNVTMTVSGFDCYRNMTNLQNGTYQFRVYATDLAGNMNVSQTRQNTVSYSPPDTIPPSITFVSPTPNNNTNATGNYIPVNVSLSENPGSCLLNWFNGAWLNYSMSIVGRSCNLNMTALANYTYQFRVYATDLAGNLNVSSGIRQNRISYSPPDTTPPTIQITSPTSNPTYSASQSPLNISGTASDNAAVTQVNWSSNRGYSGTATGTTSWSVTGITLQAGINNITVIARDAAGNTGTDMISVNYTQPCIDNDNDGYCSGVDCNDSNPNIKPNATEICNGLDDNCDSIVDPGCGSPITVTTNYYDGSTTNFSAINVSNNITGMILEKVIYGKIVFRENIKFAQSVDLDSQSNISYNRIYVNSSAFLILNKSATLYLNNLSFVNPILQRDGSGCQSSICTFVSYSGGNLTFNVTHFTEYSVAEGPYCNDTICNGGENCSSCPQDCGVCIACGIGGCQAGETCSSCPADCGQCPPQCGNVVCDSGETCSSCSSDCGQCGGGGGGGSVCTNGQTRSCSLSHSGRCASGTETCVNENWTGCPTSSSETCNHIDDDCNGITDNGLVCECFIGDTRPCGSNVGECREGTAQCLGGAGGECAGNIKPSSELCNGKDDDCDSVMDNNCTAVTSVCQDGLIPEEGCICGDKFYTIGFCYGGVYSETGPPEFPWIIVTIFGVIIILILTILIIYKEFYRKGKTDITWDDLLRKYKSSFYGLRGQGY
ncbi:MAG: Ig-like domain-containing protein, partial [Candidatus Aenigmarchaeota archaeon]|nr:Ig-like domain-containing protein [Candidatus Aenigmarchaeota archaeon]